MIAVTLLLIASLTGSAYSQCYSLEGDKFYTCIGNDVFECTSANTIGDLLSQNTCTSPNGGSTYGGSTSKPVCHPGQTVRTSVCQAAPPACTSAGLSPVVLGTGNSLTCNLFVNCKATNAAGTTFTQGVLESCPTGQNFNPAKKSCDAGYACSAVTTPSPTTCTPLSKEIDPTTCRGYRFCTLARQWTQLPCLLNTRYDPVLRMCKFPAYVQCNGRPE